MAAVRLVTFDVTNTIMKTLGSVGHNYAKIASIYETTTEPVKVDKSFRKVFKRYNESYPNFGVSRGLTTGQWWDNVVKETFEDAGSDLKSIDQISKHLFLHFSTNQGWEIIQGAEETLRTIKQSGIKLGVISNFDERLEKILTQLALRHYFDFIICSSVVKIAKPEKGIFEMALKMAGVDSSESLHVGDNLTTDYNGARSIGMKALLYSNSENPMPEDVSADHVITDLSGVLSYLKLQ